MDNADQTESSQGASCTVRTVDAVTAVLIILLGAIVIYDSVRIGAAWEPNVGPQAGYFPFYIGLLLVVCSGATLFQAVVLRKGGRSVFVTWGEFRQVLKVLLPSLAFALAVQLIGIYVSSILFIGGFMLWLGKYRILPAVLVSVGVSAVMFWMFEIRFLIPLPKGPIEAMFGY
jgi:hypothetical protein